MLFDPFSTENEAKVAQLENSHRGRHGMVIGLLSAGLVMFLLWAMLFKIDEVASAKGEVIASSRVQVIQAVDGGVLSELNVREGDHVNKGQILAKLDQTRIGAAVGEIGARLRALKAKAFRLRSEVANKPSLDISKDQFTALGESAKIEQAVFTQRRIGLEEELRTLQVTVRLAREQLSLVEQIQNSGDVSRAEYLRVQRDLNDAEAKLVNRKNKFLEDARLELAKVEDEMAQNEQILTQRSQQLHDSVFIAQTLGIVKNIRVTTVGGVLRAGEEIMQIVPLDDELILEAKVSPADIARVKPGLDATIRFDPFDYTLYGGVKGKVTYVSADTLKEDTQRGKEIYYRVHVSPVVKPVLTTTGKQLEILPGMTAQVDIRTGDRTLMDYLLKPVRRTVSEAFGER